MAQALPAVALAKAGLRPQDARREAQGAELGAKREDLVTFFFLLPTPDFGLRTPDFRLIIIMIVFPPFILQI